MKRHIILIPLALSVLTLGLTVGCTEGVQTFSKHDISFKVYDQGKLEEYTVSIQGRTFQKGATSYDEGAVMDYGKGLIFLWVKVPNFTLKEARSAILSAPEIHESTTTFWRGASSVEVMGNPVAQRVAGYAVTFACLKYEYAKGGPGSGITAVWYCPASQRMMQLILAAAVDEEPKEELDRFLSSFSCE